MIRIRVIDQNPALYLVDKIKPGGAADECELLTLSVGELRDAKAAIDAALTASPGAYVTAIGGHVEVNL